MIHSWGKYLWYLYVALVLGFLVMPTFIVIPISFSPTSYFQFPPDYLSLRYWADFINQPRWREVFLMSLRVGIMATIFSAIIGSLAALALSKIKFRFQGVIVSILLSPMIIPVIVLAIAMYSLFAKWYLIGKPVGLALAHSVLAIPYVFINVSAALQSFDDSLENAALSMGANRIRSLLSVKLPLIMPGVIAGMLLAFVISFDELVIALFLSGAGARTLPLEMWDGIRQEMTPIIAVASSVLITFYFMLFVLYELFKISLEPRKTRTKLQKEEV